MSREQAGFRPDVEGLRAVAVGLVVAFHAGVPFVSGGFVGVDVFFVLSGFLITGLLAGELTREGSLSFARFYGRRARRLLPMSALVLAVTAVAFSFVVSPLDRGEMAADLQSAALYVANWHFAVGSLDYLSDPTRSPVLHYWSLGVEEQFYVVWPLLLVLAGRSAARRGAPEVARARMLVALAALAVASFVVSVWQTTAAPPWAYYGLHTRAWELAVGGVVALSTPWLVRLPARLRSLLALAGVVTVVVSAMLIGDGTPFPGLAALGPVLGTAAVVVAGAGSAVGVGRWLSARPLTYIGRLSYSWYLWHWPCLIFASVVAASGFAPRGYHALEPARGWAALLAIAVSFVLSVVSHRLLEDPVRRSAWLAAARPRSLALGAVLTVAAVAAVAVALPPTDGAPRGPVLAEVAAIRASPALQSSPATERRVTLAMSPAQARADEPHGVRDCYAGYLATTAPADCLFGDPAGDRTIALVGDSHAEQWFPALEQAAVEHHWRLYMWSKSACPLIDLPVRLPQFANAYPWCAEWRAAVLERLASLPDLDAVVVSHYGSLISRGSRFAASDGRALPGSELPTAWRDAWQRTGKRLAGLAGRVVLLRDVPKPPVDVPACLATHGTDARPCSFARAFAFDRADLLYDAERAAGVPGQEILDVDDLLCPGDPCPVVTTDGTIVYRDAHHLTASISRELGPAIGRRLAALLRA